MALTRTIEEALRSGDATRIAAEAKQGDPSAQALWSGILALTRNQPNQAIQMLRRAGQPKPLGVAYYMARQYILFRDQMAEAIRRDPADFAPYYYLGRHYDTEFDNVEEAASWFRKALERKPDYLQARYFLGSCSERLGHFGEAEQAYQSSLPLPQAQIGLARLRLASGDTASALAFAETALEQNSRDVAGQKLAARIYAKRDRPGDALRALKLAARLAPGDPATHYQIYRTYLLLGEREKGADALREFERLRAIYGLQPH